MNKEEIITSLRDLQQMADGIANVALELENMLKSEKDKEQLELQEAIHRMNI